MTCGGAALALLVATGAAEAAAKLQGPLPVSAASYPFNAAAHQAEPIDLARYGYVEEEYLMYGEGQVYALDGSTPRAQAKGPYVTRILVRRPKSAARFSGVAIVEPLNPSVDVDLQIMWAESHLQFMADGHAWVGMTIKPNTIKALRKFDPTRYQAVAMPNPRGAPACAEADITPNARPTTGADETGLAWDMITDLGRLLKAPGAGNPLGKAAARLYMTGQSQNAGYARTYATFFARDIKGPNGKLLYDAYLYSGSPPWQVPINQCAKDPPPGDPRLLTGPAGAPVIELFTQGDLSTNVESRRPDADKAPDLFRRYEVAGGSHIDPWEGRSDPTVADDKRAGGRNSDGEPAVCRPKGVTPTDFPNRYVFNAAWRSLDAWVRRGVPAPKAAPLELVPGAAKLVSDRQFVLDANGNAKGGVRSPAVDAPTARWVGAKSGAFSCIFYGYKFPFDQAKLKALYGDHAGYVAKVRASVRVQQAGRWLTSEDAAEIVREAEAAKIP
jgi:hypothetical protein